MSIIFMKNGNSLHIEIPTNICIVIKDFRKFLSIRTQVTDFVNIIENCRYRSSIHINHPSLNRSYTDSELEYYKKYGNKSKKGNIHIIEKHKEMINGKNETFSEKELNRFLKNIKEDINFARESVKSRLSITSKIGDELILVGQPDKILRKNGNLIIEEDKPGDKYNLMYHKYSTYILQASVYSKSKFSVDYRPTIKNVGKSDGDHSTYDNTYTPPIDQAWGVIQNVNDILHDYDRNSRIFFDIPHQKKILRINIKDPKMPVDIENNIVGTLETEYNKNIHDYLRKSLSNFLHLATAAINGDHYDNFKKCNICQWDTCPIILLRYWAKQEFKGISMK